MADAERRRGWREHPLTQLTLTRYREFIREPEALFWTFIFPVLLAAGLGLAFRSKPPDIARIAVREGPAAGPVLDALRADSRIAVEQMDSASAAAALRTGSVAVLVEVLAADSLVYHFDGTRPEAQMARLLADGAVQRAAGRSEPVATADSPARERGARYIDFLLPGLLAMNLMGTGVWGTGFAVVDQRRKRLLKRLVATPMFRSHYLLSFVFSRLGLLVGEVGVLIGFGVLVFGVPVRGSIGALILLSVLAGLMFGAFGLLLAARPRTIEGASGVMNFALLPMWVLSGVFFSAGNFPDVLQPFIQVLPLTAAVDAFRAHMLEGASLTALGSEVGLMTLWTVGSLATALRIFRWQ